MSDAVQMRGGTTAENNAFTGLIREITVDTEKKTLVVHDGATLGGFPLATEAKKDAASGYVGKTLEKINIWNAARTAMSFLSSLATAQRNYRYPDKDIDVAGLDDIAAALSGIKVAPPSRQTCLSGPVDSNGFAAFGGSTGTTTVTASGTLIVTAAGGFSATGSVDRIGSITNPSWTGASTNGTMYAYLDVAADGTCTPGLSTAAPVYIPGGTPSITNGVFTFDYTKYIGYLGNGASAPATYRVYVGQFTVAGGVVTAITWYQLNGQYDTGRFSITSSTTYTKNHNIGTDSLIITNLIATSGGAWAQAFFLFSAGYYGTILAALTSTSIALRTQDGMLGPSSTTNGIPTTYNEARIILKRSW